MRDFILGAVAATAVSIGYMLVVFAGIVFIK